MLLKLVPLESLLVFKLLLSILVTLEDLIVLYLAKLQSFIHLALKFLSQGIHLDLLLLYKFCLCSKYLFMAVFHVLLTLLLFHLVGSLLDLMCLLIIFLLGEIHLDLSQVKELRGEFEFKRQLLLKLLTVEL